MTGLPLPRPGLRSGSALAAGLLALAAICLAAPAVHAELRPDFRVRVGEPDGPAPPLFAEDVAYVVDSGGRVHALDARTGRLRWHASVRCGRSLHAAGGRLACADPQRGRLLVLDDQSGRLLARQRLEGGPFAIRPVESALVFHELASGRVLGYDVSTLTWAFDHGTESDGAAARVYEPLSLGSRYLYTEDQWRTLKGVDVQSGRNLLVVRSDTPVRSDRGRWARLTRGRVVSHDAYSISAYDVRLARPAWRIDLKGATGLPTLRIERAELERGQVLLLASAPVAPQAEDDPPLQALFLVTVDVDSGALTRFIPLATALPLPLAAHLVAPRDAGCGRAEVGSLALVGERPVLTFVSPCGVRGGSAFHGTVVLFAAAGGDPAWVTPPGTAKRVLSDPEHLYGLWGGRGVPHRERAAVQLDPHDGAELARPMVGYTPSWGRIQGDRLWVGTTSGTVVVFQR